MTLFEEIGEHTVKQVIAAFYRKAFTDPIIGHFFFGKDEAELVSKQTSFAASMLGSKSHPYQGKPLRQAHQGLRITMAHFGRRQVLMKETLAEHGVEPTLAETWLNLEQQLKPLIFGSAAPSCGPGS